MAGRQEDHLARKNLCQLSRWQKKNVKSKTAVKIVTSFHIFLPTFYLSDVTTIYYSVTPRVIICKLATLVRSPHRKVTRSEISYKTIY